MNTQPETLKSLDEKFTSGNSIPVQQATITKDEYLELRRLHEEVQCEERRFNELWDSFAEISKVNKELVEALKTTTSRLVAASSLLERGGKKAAASDKIFKIVLSDYKYTIDVGRAALLKTQGETK